MQDALRQKGKGFSAFVSRTNVDAMLRGQSGGLVKYDQTRRRMLHFSPGQYQDIVTSAGKLHIAESSFPEANARLKIDMAVIAKQAATPALVMTSGGCALLFNVKVLCQTNQSGWLAEFVPLSEPIVDVSKRAREPLAEVEDNRQHKITKFFK